MLARRLAPPLAPRSTGGLLAVTLLVLGGTWGWSAAAHAEETAPAPSPTATPFPAPPSKSETAPQTGGTPAAAPAKRRGASRSAPATTESADGQSGAKETISLEIVAKAPKPIPPVELDMLQLRLMLTDLKASFAGEIERALFQDPF